MKLWMAPAGLHIEPATLSDAKTLADLHARAFYRGWPTGEFATYIDDARQTPTYIATDARHHIAGFAIIRLVEDEAELLTIVVEDKWRAKGVGKSLLRAAIDDLTMTPARRLFLEVEDANVAALALYKGLGFEDVARREGYYTRPDGTKAAAVVMRCELD